MKINVYIHIGPPKTATSAIQNWLQNNQNLLLNRGIFYPDHNLDENGISSGNVLNVFDRNENAKLLLSATKVKHLLHLCEKNKCDTLLLSSEFFFFHVSDLLNAFPQAKFIAYLRFPLDVIESSYNQAVKRHGEVKAFGIADEPQAYHLRLLELMIDKHAIEHFVIKFYSSSMFVRGDIVCDFLSIFGIETEPQDKIVNPSYTFQTLEVKRWLNQFMQSEHQQRVDGFLQAFGEGDKSYSLIHPKKYEYYREYFFETLDTFFKKYQVENSQRYLDEIKVKKQDKFLTQKLQVQEFKNVMDELAKKDQGLILTLSKQTKVQSSKIEKRPEFIEVLNASVPRGYLLTTYIDELFHSFKFRLKRLFISSFRLRGNDDNSAAITDTMRIRKTLKIADSLSEGEIYRELALFCEQNGEIRFAYRLMKEASRLRPNGPLIIEKLSQYQEELNIQDDIKVKRK